MSATLTSASSWVTTSQRRSTAMRPGHVTRLATTTGGGRSGQDAATSSTKRRRAVVRPVPSAPCNTTARCPPSDSVSSLIARRSLSSIGIVRLHTPPPSYRHAVVLKSIFGNHSSPGRRMLDRRFCVTSTLRNSAARTSLRKLAWYADEAESSSSEAD